MILQGDVLSPVEGYSCRSQFRITWFDKVINVSIISYKVKTEMKYYISSYFHCAIERHFLRNCKLKCHWPTAYHQVHELVKYHVIIATIIIILLDIIPKWPPQGIFLKTWLIKSKISVRLQKQWLIYYQGYIDRLYCNCQRTRWLLSLWKRW